MHSWQPGCSRACHIRCQQDTVSGRCDEYHQGTLRLHSILHSELIYDTFIATNLEEPYKIVIRIDENNSVKDILSAYSKNGNLKDSVFDKYIKIIYNTLLNIVIL